MKSTYKVITTRFRSRVGWVWIILCCLFEELIAIYFVYRYIQRLAPSLGKYPQPGLRPFSTHCTISNYSSTRQLSRRKVFTILRSKIRPGTLERSDKCLTGDRSRPWYDRFQDGWRDPSNSERRDGIPQESTLIRNGYPMIPLCHQNHPSPFHGQPDHHPDRNHPFLWTVSSNRNNTEHNYLIFNDLITRLSNRRITSFQTIR